MSIHDIRCMKHRAYVQTNVLQSSRQIFNKFVPADREITASHPSLVAGEKYGTKQAGLFIISYGGHGCV